MPNAVLRKSAQRQAFSCTPLRWWRRKTSTCLGG